MSPVFPAFNTAAADLGSAKALLLCFPKSPSLLLADIQNELPSELQARTMIGYGLASVLMAGELIELTDHASKLQAQLTAWELWPLADGIVLEGEVKRYVREVKPVEVPPISSKGLPYDAACQVRQLNVSLDLAIHRASVYSPELVEVFLALSAAAGRLVDELREIESSQASVDSVRKHHYYLSRVLEINAGLAMVISQTLGGVPPLLTSDYPVGEYGLLGIGTASRALWSFYHPLRRSFSNANHVARLAETVRSLTHFDPFLDWRTLDYRSWGTATARLENLPKVSPTPAGAHLVHFSSRFGFHETEYTLGASWQSLHASAGRDWHLLTLTHEFLHSHVRQLTAVIFPEDTNWERLSSVFGGAQPATALESMQAAFANGMMRYQSARQASSGIFGEKPQASSHFNSRPSASQLRELVGQETRFLQEIVVHTLDFLYTFAGDTRSYLAAIWQSWSTVPSVTERIHDYLLRSLCALAAGDSIMPERETADLFNSVRGSAITELRALAATDADSPVVDRAVEYLEGVAQTRRLELEFAQAYYIARLTREFFFDQTLATTLREDKSTTLGDETGARYIISPGEYPDQPIQSPVSFLSDRFGQATNNGGPELEFASLWQLLLLISPRNQG